MLSLISLLSLVKAEYSFPVGVSIPFHLRVQFSGDLPIFGGKKADVDAHMDASVSGLVADEQGRSRVTSELTDLKMYLNGTQMPFTVKNVQTFFPKTTISYSSTGEVLQTDAPDLPLPVRLPGLDAKRFAEICYLPILLNPDGLELQKSFKFSRSFGGEPVKYTVTPTLIEDSSIQFSIVVEQHYEAFEDTRHNPTTDNEKETYRVQTQVSGDGTARFDRKLGRIVSSHIEATAISKITGITDPTFAGSRNLKTTLDIDSTPPE